MCILSGDGGCQVRDVDVKEKGRQDRSLSDAILETSQPPYFAVSGGEDEAAIANHLHDHEDHVSIRQQLQQLAGEAKVPCSVVGCCQIDKHSSGPLFSRKATLDVLCQQGDLVYDRPPVSKARLLPREQWIDDCVDTSVDESLEDFKGDTQQGYGR